MNGRYFNRELCNYMLLFLENFLIVLFSSLFVFSKTGSFIVIPYFIIFFSMGLWSGMIHSNIKPFIFIVFVIFTAAFNRNLAFFSPVFIAMNLEAEEIQKNYISLIFKFLPLLCVFFNFDLIFFLFTLIIFFYSGVKENYLLKTLEVTGLKDKLTENKINSEKRERILENEILKNAEVLILAERNRISGSLHNSIGHTLSAGILQVNALKYISNQQEVKDSLNIQSVNDLVDQQLMTNRNPGNGIYKPEVVSYHDQSPYVGVRMMTGIYGGNTSDGAPGAVSFKHNAFRLWGYYGYENGFLGYASNKLKQASKADGNTVLSDKYIINKISGGRFSTLEEFKKAYFQEVKDKAKVGLTTFEVNGTSVSSYDELLALFKDAVTKDAQTLKVDNNGNKSVSMNNTLKLKEDHSGIPHSFIQLVTPVRTFNG